jgi:predicted DNA-binding transcriptional regulator AlpA
MTAALKFDQVKTAEQTYSAADVARLLGISQATFFRIAWFKSRKVRLSAQRVGYLASDVSLYQTLRRGV